MNMNQMNQFNYQNNRSIKLMGLSRLRKEFSLCEQDDELMQIGCSFGLYDNNMFTWKVTMLGPNNTPYEGGIFTIKIFFPDDYPNHGAEFRFINKIYHLNVDPGKYHYDKIGHISLNFINSLSTSGERSLYFTYPYFGAQKLG